MDQLENNLEPLPYHVELRDYLKSRERELWNWFASARAQADYMENLRMDLLKSCYRLDPGGHEELYASMDQAKTRLNLDIPVTLYQAQNSSQLNALLYFMPKEGHIVFSGSILSLLGQEELKSVIGHELAHHHLWGRHDGDFHVADRLLQAVAADPRSAPSHEQSARRYQLYTEIFADRGSLAVTGNLDAVISGLVKIQTGLPQVSAQGYLKQAEEIFAKGHGATEELSHPESFIRARALALWQKDGAEAAPRISKMIAGEVAFDSLDLVGQTRLFTATRRLLEYYLSPKWFQTSAVLGHAKLFFADFRPASAKIPSLLEELRFSDPKLRDYFCYVLLDFVSADPELEEVPLAAALNLTRELEMETQFEKIAAKELKMKVRDVRKIKEQATEMLAKAEAQRE